MKPTFRDILTSSQDRFPIGVEVVSTRGTGHSAALHIPLFQDLLSDERIDWLSITDNPSGHPMLSPDYLAGVLGQPENIVVHLTCKDTNRHGLESQLWRYASEGLNNILALSGDLPVTGYPKLGKSVFDIDSTALLKMMSDMNAGLQVPGHKAGTTDTLSATHFFTGCCVSPFKKNENELVPQYYKLLKKIRAGAAWVLPQLGYDMRKFNEIKQFLTDNEIRIPVIGNVYVLSLFAAKLFNSGKLAGCIVSDKFLAVIEKNAGGADKGKAYFQELAAKQLAVFKGLGFAAGYIGGITQAEDVFAIIEKSRSFAEDDWKQFYEEIQYPQENEFYLPDKEQDVQRRKTSRNINLFYRFSRCVHALAFHKGHQLYPLLRRAFAFLDSHPRCLKCLHGIEDLSKHILYGCKDCGDCALPDTAYVCPMSQCSKNMRNGPCGGSAKSRCEADDKECIWTIAYDRLKHFQELDTFKNADVSVYDAALEGTSAWSNLYAERDHAGF